MGVGRRQVLLGGLGLGLAAARPARAAALPARTRNSAGLQHLRRRAGGRRDRPDRDAATCRRPGGGDRHAAIPSRRDLFDQPPHAQIRHPDRRRAGTIDPALSRRRRAAQPRGGRECAAGRPRARRRRQTARRRRRAARRDRGEASRSRRLPLRRQRRERRGAAQSVGLDQGLRDRRHPQSRPVQRGRGRT